MDTKDITELKQARMRREAANEKKAKELFNFSVNKEQEQKQFRRELEQAYEREKSKVSDCNTKGLRFNLCMPVSR